MNIFYIAATDRMSWGRGTREWEALGHALFHSGREAKKAVLFQVTCPEGSVEADVYVNDMGSICAPKGSEVKDLDSIDLRHVAAKFYSYFDALDAMLEDEAN